MITTVGFSFAYLALACLAITCTLCIWKYKSLPEPIRLLSHYLFFNLLIEVCAKTIPFPNNNNLPLLHLYTLGEFVLLSLFFKSLIKKPSAFQKYFWVFIGLFLVLIIGNTIFLQGIFEFNSYAKTGVQVVLITYSVLYFYNLSNEVDLTNPYQKSLRLINSALLIYFSGSLFIFMFSNYLTKHKIDIHHGFWAFNAFLNLVFQILVLVGIWRVTFRRAKSSS